MSVTDKLLKVYRVDQQITGLRSRLRAAERFLNEQVGAIEHLSTQATAVDSQLRQLKASAADAEGEAARLSERIDELRQRMSTVNSNKEYQALLTEVNTHKDAKTAAESKAVELLEKAEALDAQREQLGEQLGERERVRGVADGERAQRAEEIRDKLTELESQREGLIGDVPRGVLSTYEELVGRLEEDAMAPIEIQDRRRHEFTCGACMMAVPVEAMSALLSHGDLTRCVSCGAILFLEEKTRERMLATSKK